MATKSPLMMRRFGLLAGPATLAAIALVGAQARTPTPVGKPFRVPTAEERLAGMGPFLVDYRPSLGLLGKALLMDVRGWISETTGRTTAGLTPAPSRGGGSVVVGCSSRAYLLRQVPSGMPVADMIQTVTPEGNIVAISPDGEQSRIYLHGNKPLSAFMVYGPSALKRAPTHRTLLYQPDLRLDVSEERGARVPRSRRRFTLAAQVRMAEYTQDDRSDGPIDVVYAKTVTAEVPRTVAFAAYEDPDLEAAMKLAIPKALHEFAVRVGAARLRSPLGEDYVRISGVSPQEKERILAEAAGPLDGWKKSAALP